MSSKGGRGARLVRDAATGAMVLLAPGRSARPSTFAPGAVNPFAEGNESQTLPETACVRRRGSCPNGPGWMVRIVGNKFPLTVETRVGSMIGAHEVLIESPDPERDLADQSARHLAMVLRLARDRMRELESMEGVAWVGMFRNTGAAAGASIAHPHMQILALPFTPPLADRAPQGARRTREGAGVVLERTTHHAVVAAGAPQVPYELQVRPRGRLRAFTRESDAGIVDLARLLRKWLRAMRRHLGNPPYNLVFAPAPGHGGRWMLRVLPRLGQFGGFEFATGMWVSSVTSEEAAAALRRAASR